MQHKTNKKVNKLNNGSLNIYAAQHKQNNFKLIFLNHNCSVNDKTEPTRRNQGGYSSSLIKENQNVYTQNIEPFTLNIELFSDRT